MPYYNTALKKCSLASFAKELVIPIGKIGKIQGHAIRVYLAPNAVVRNEGLPVLQQ